MKEVSESHLGKSVYASAIILGAAFQMGLIPFDLKDLEDAFSRTMKKAELANNLEAFTLGRRLALGEDLRIAAAAIPMIDLYESSVKESSLFNGSSLVELLKAKKNETLKIIPVEFKIPEEFIARYLHDMIIFDRGAHIDSFITDVKKLVSIYSGREADLFAMALRSIAKTYFIKDEVYIAHMMISPMRKLSDDKNYGDLGTSYKKTFLNRPSFDLGEKKLEFDFSPSKWMLKIMRHARFLRALLTTWHKQERKISNDIRSRILNQPLSFKELKSLENIKGYRQVRYDMYSSL